MIACRNYRLLGVDDKFLQQLHIKSSETKFDLQFMLGIVVAAVAFAELHPILKTIDIPLVFRKHGK